ncbi:MAG: Hsp20/alpha crystallin family protein [Candidatus Bathyarchaeia archaeon]
MRWRKSEKRPKWFRTVKRHGKVEDRVFKLESLKTSRQHSHKYKGLKTFSFKVKKWREPEPLVDVFREKDKIIVVAELKGYKKENIKVKAENQRLILTAKAQGRRFYKSLNLPEAVIPEAARITYKNGVLEIQLKKAPEERPLNKVAG